MTEQKLFQLLLSIIRRRSSFMKSTKKINIIDIIIVVAVLTVVGISIFRAVMLRNSGKLLEEKSITYTITVTELDKRYSSSVVADDSVYYSDKSLLCGKISDVYTEYSRVNETVTDNNGKISVINRINPSKVDMIITVNTIGKFSDTMLYLGQNTYITEGQKIEFYTDTYTFSGIVSDFTVNTDN